MSKASPIILVAALVATAIFLSLRTPHPTPAATAPQPPATREAPAQMDPPAAQASQTNTTPRPQPWAHEGSDIPADPKATFGTLENGMRYVVYPNSEPPGRISVRLHIRAGSLMEQDDQRGLAHFLEHMMFNGTRHYTAEELIPRMQRLGIAFGAHANAYTSFDETVYMLDLPDLSAETMELAFTVMRDFADGALLTAEEIDKERGVILAEKISRDSVGYRLMQQQFSTLLPASLISHRFPIGLDEVIQSAPRQRFVDFYQQYYTPDRMTFVVVGDIDPEAIGQRIRDTFGSMVNPQNRGADPDLGKVEVPDGLNPAVFQDPEVDSTEVSLLLARPFSAQPDKRQTRADKLALDIAHSILGRRFERIAKQEGSAIAEGSASRYPLFNAVELGSIDLTASDDHWQQAVPVLETEFRRALEHGFTEAELTEAKANVINAAEQAVAQRESRKSEDLASRIAQSLNDGKVFSSPESDLEIVRSALDAIHAASCHEAFRQFWQSSGYHLVLTTKEAPASAQKELQSLYQESRRQPVTAPAARAVQIFDYTNFGTPGKVTRSTTIDDLGITQITLSNNIRVNLKPTDFEKGKVRILARIGSGQLSQPAESPMLDQFAQAIYDGGGLGKHSNDDLQRILAGRNVSSSLDIAEDAFVLGGTTTPDDFTLQCQIMCAGIIDPGFRDEALRQFHKAVPMLEQQLKHTPAGPVHSMKAWLRGNDPRFEVVDAARLTSYTIDDAKSWLMPELTHGYLELSIIGDFDPAVVMPTVLETFGALPARAATPPEMADARRIKFPNAPARKSLSYDSKIPQGIAVTVWKTMPMRGNLRDFRRLNVLADILANRIREEIREKLGASYSPNAAASGTEALDNLGYLVAQSSGTPEDLELLHRSMRDLAEQLAQKGATQDELDRSIKPIAGMIEKTKRDNNYWLATVMANSQADPGKIELARHRDSDYQSISLAEINALAKKYLAAENAISISIQSAHAAE